MIPRTTRLGLAAEYVLLTSPFESLDDMRLPPQDLSRETSCPIIGLDLDGISPCDNEHLQGSRRERETD